MQREAEGDAFAQPKGERGQECLTDVYNYLKGGWRQDGAKVSLEMHSDRVRGSRHRLKQIIKFTTHIIGYYNLKSIDSIKYLLGMGNSDVWRHILSTQKTLGPFILESVEIRRSGDI